MDNVYLVMNSEETAEELLKLISTMADIKNLIIKNDNELNTLLKWNPQPIKKIELLKSNELKYTTEYKLTKYKLHFLWKIAEEGTEKMTLCINDHNNIYERYDSEKHTLAIVQDSMGKNMLAYFVKELQLEEINLYENLE